MPTATKNYGQVKLSSSYTAYTENTGTGSMHGTSSATNADSATFYADFATLGITAGSTINSASFTYTQSTYPLHGFDTKALMSGSTTVDSSFNSGDSVVLGAIPSFFIRFKTGKENTSYPAPPGTVGVIASQTNSSTWTIDNVTLTVDYTLPYTKCTAPTTVTIASTNVAPGASVNLSWSGAKAGTNNAITKYAIYRSTSSGGTYSWLADKTASPLAVTAPSTNGSSYYYKIITVGTVSGYNSGYSGASGALTCSFSAPKVPSSITFASNNVAPGATVKMSWTGHSAGTNNPITKYEVYRATSSGGTYTLLSSPTSASLNVSARTTNGSSYYYKILVKGTYSDSGYSSASGAFTCSFSAPSVSAVKVNSSSSAIYLTANTNLTLSWTGTAGTNNAIKSYTILKNGSAYLTGITGTSRTVSTSTSSGNFYYSVQPIGTHSNGSSVNSPYVYTYTACTAPTTLTVGSTNVAPNASVTLSWSGAGSGGANNTISGYIIYRATTSGGSYSQVTTATGTSVSVSAPTTNGGTYYYKVVTKGTQQNSGYSSASSALTCSFSAPTAPTSVSLSSSRVKSGNVTLSWSGAKAGTNNPIASYDVYRAGVYYSNTTSTSMAVPSHATAGSSYAYTVYTRGAHSNSGASSAVTVYTITDPSAPTTISLSATDVAPGKSVTLSWSGAVAGTLNAITGYKIYRSTTSGGSYSLLTSVSVTTTSGTKSVSAPSTLNGTYFYKVVTQGTYTDSAQSAASSDLTCYYTNPPAPTALTFSANNVTPSSSVTLSWSASNGTNNAVSSYEIHRSTTAGGTYSLLTTSTTKSKTVTAQATLNAKYYYKIVSIGTISGTKSGMSAASAALNAYYTSPAVSAVKLNSGTSNIYVPVSTGTATLSWTGTAGTNNPIKSYTILKNGAAYKTGVTAKTYTVDTSTSSGSFVYNVKPVGTYSNGTGVNSPYLYTYTACLPPTSLSLSGTNVAPGASVTLSWSGAGNGGSYNTISKYDIYRATSSAGTYSLITSVTSTATTGSVSVTAPSSNGGTYYYKIITKGTQQDSTYSSVSSALKCSFSAPKAPTSVAVSSAYVKSGNVTLSWSGASAGTNNPIKKYSVYQNGAYYDETTSTSLSVPSHATAGNSYTYTVYTIGTYSNSGASSAKKVYTYSDPSAPSTLTVSGTNTAPGASVTLSWSGASAGEYNAIASYKILRSTTAGGTYTQITTKTTTATSGSVSVTAPSSNGGTYFYKVVTVGSQSESARSAASSALTCSFTAPTVSAVKVNSSSSAIYVPSASTVSLSWTGASGTNNAIKSYTIYKDGVAIKTGQTSSPFSVSASTNTSAVFSVVAVGTHSNSSSVNSPTVYGYNTVGLVSNFATSASTPNANTSVTLSWTAPSAVNYNNVDGYSVYRSTNNVDFTLLSTVTATSLAVTSHATMGSAYYYKIKTEGSRADSGYSSTVTVTSKVYTKCGAPSSVSWNTSASNLAPNTARTLNWSGASGGTNNKIAGYKIYKSTDNATYTLHKTITSTASSGSLSITSPATNATHYYKIITVGSNTAFNSPYSSTVSIKTLFTAPTVSNVRLKSSSSAVSALKGSNVTLSWSSSAGTNNPILSYDIYRGGVFYANTTSTSHTVVAHSTESSSYTYSVKALGTHVDSSTVSAPVLYSYSSATAPTSVSVASNNVAPGATIKLNWSGAVGGGTYNPITGYAIYRSTSSTSGYTLLSSISSTATSGSLNVVSHSSSGTAYYYKVVTACQNADSAQSSVFATLTTYFTAPKVSAVKIAGSSSSVYVLAGSTTSVMTWTGTAGTNNPIVSYNIFRDGSSWATTTSTSYSVVSNPTAGSNFVYTIYPVGKYSTGAGVNSPTYYSCSLPALPKAFSASPVSPDANTTFTLSWSGAAGGTLNPIVEYEVYRSTSLNGTYTRLITTNSSSASATSHATMTSSYYYKIKVIGEHLSSGLSSALSVTSKLYTVPFPPNTVSLSKTLTLVPDEDITLSWSSATAGTNNPVTAYQVHRSTAENGTYTLFSTTPSTFATVKSNATYGNMYFYKVLTVGTKSGFLNSPFSGTVSIETSMYTFCSNPLSLKLNGLTSDAIVDNSATLSWTASTEGVNNPLTGYEIQERVYSENHQLLQDWRNATNLSGTPSYTTASTSISVYPPAMYQYKKFRVKAIGTVDRFDSEYTELTSKLYRKIYTACGAPVLATPPNIAEVSFNLTWSGAVAGVNNAIAGYNIQYCESSDNGSTWGAWTNITTVNSGASSGSYSVPVSSTRGYHRKYRIRTQGSASSTWYSPYSVSSVVKSNLLPAVPTFSFPKTSKIVYGPNVYVGAILGSEPESHSQKIAYEVVQNSTVISSGESPTYTTTGSKVFRINMGSFTNDAMTLKIRSVDSLGGASDYAQVTLTGQTLTWTRNISAGMVISNHIADINDLLSKVNTVRDSYGLSAITLTGTVGHFSNWYPQMIQIRNAVAEIYQLVQASSPVWISSASGYPNAAVFNQIKTAVMNLI